MYVRIFFVNKSGFFYFSTFSFSARGYYTDIVLTCLNFVIKFYHISICMMIAEKFPSFLARFFGPQNFDILMRIVAAKN